MVRFSDSFWDKDPNGTTGYEILVKRLKDGKKTCDEFSEFLKQRAKAEDDYGKALIRLAQQAGGSDEIGSLKDSFDVLKRETENIGSTHCELSKKFEELDKSLRTFREDQKNERAKMDEKMKRLQKEKRIAYDGVNKAKRQYEQRCKELDAATETLEGISHYTPKEEEKLRNKKVKTKTTQEGADQHYQSCVKILEQAHEVWEQEMEVTCDKFQEMEEVRIRFLRNEMWLYSNIGSQANVDEDKMYEDVRLTLEKCDDAKDVIVFIHSKQTGSERPTPLKYENYYHPSKVNGAASDQQKYKFLSLGKTASPRTLMPSASMPSIVSGSGDNNADDESDYAVVRSDIPPPSSHVTPQAAHIPHQRGAQNLLLASFDYIAQGAEEISLRKGDVIQILGIEYEEWGRGKNQRSGATGVFPLAFVQKLTN